MTSQWRAARLTMSPDPYGDWALGPGRPYLTETLGSQPVFTTLIRRGAPMGVPIPIDDLKSAFNAAALGPHGGALPPIVHISPYYDHPDLKTRLPLYLTAVVTERFFALLAGNPRLRTLVPSASLGLPTGYRTPSAAGAATPAHVAPTRGTVVVGVIDDGIAIAHERFRRPDGSTRVEYAWVQDAETPATGAPAGFGREFLKSEIDGLLGQCTHGDIVDEDAFYRRASLADFSRPGHKGVSHRSSHGSHVMDVAAGHERGDAEAGKRPIICVQLPADTTADTSGARLDPYVYLAMNYILDRANKLAAGGPTLPVVINFSYGTIAGPHDGTGDLEAAIDEFVEIHVRPKPVAVVLPSGNSHLSRCHARMTFQTSHAQDPAKGSHELQWRIQPDDRTSSFLEIWMPHAAAIPAGGRVEIRIEPPGQGTLPASNWIGETHGAGEELTIDGTVVGRAIYALDPYPHPTGRGRFVISLLPTTFLGPPAQLAPCGVWRIRLRNLALAGNEAVRAWIQRDDTPHGYPRRGRQSYLDHADYLRFDLGGREVEVDDPGCIVKRAGLVSAIATGARPVVIGGYMEREDRPARYSAGGPTTPKTNSVQPFRRGPDALAISDNSRVHAGVLAAGTRSGSVVALNGTSVAAPLVARWIASELEAGGIGDRPAVRARAAADDPGHAPPPPPPERGGSGRLSLRPVHPLERLWK